MLCLVAILQRRAGESLSLLPSQSKFTWAAEIRGWKLQLTEKSQQPRLKETAASDVSVRTYSLIINAEFFVTPVASVGWVAALSRDCLHSSCCFSSSLFLLSVYFSPSLCSPGMWQLYTLKFPHKDKNFYYLFIDLPHSNTVGEMGTKKWMSVRLTVGAGVCLSAWHTWSPCSVPSTT